MIGTRYSLAALAMLATVQAAPATALADRAFVSANGLDTNDCSV